MSIFDDATVAVWMADYAAADASGKLNLLGAGFNLLQPVPPMGATAPFTVVAVIRVPALQHAGSEYVASLELYDLSANRTFQVPTQSGQLEALRFQQAVQVEIPQIPQGFTRPSDVLSLHQIAATFSDGLALTPGSSYEWRVHVDGQDRKDWAARFHFLKPPSAPLFGGPAGSASIPDIAFGQRDDQSQ